MLISVVQGPAGGGNPKILQPGPELSQYNFSRHDIFLKSRGKQESRKSIKPDDERVLGKQRVTSLPYYQVDRQIHSMLRGDYDWFMDSFSRE